VDRRVQQVLEGLGFSREMYHQSANQLSGGQQSRLVLAQLLLASPDLLLLDEPSNHLDLPATQWLEEFLAGSGQSLLIVSHDRYLLDRVTQHTLELFHGTVDRYRGNFSAYWRQKAERLAVQQREYDKQQEEIQRMEDFIRRNQYGQKHAQAEDRRKKLERMEPVARPRRIEAPPMRFPDAQRSGDIVLRLSGVSKSFQTPLFERLELQIQRGEKWGIFGRNGTGKTTLLRCMVGELAPDEGRVERGAGVRIGYFDQRLEQMDEDLAVVDAIRTPNCPLDEPGRRSLLARFGITGDMAFQPVRSLSGGERNRVALSKLVIDNPNLLVMDEPTNHLDLWARDALESALSQFNGTVVLVSHDRYFLNRVVDHLLVLDERPARVVHGNYRDFLDLQLVASASHAEAGSTGRRPSEKNAGADPSRRRRQFPYRKVHDIEAEITDHEQQIEALQLRLSDPDVVRDPEKIKSLQEEIARRQQQLATLYEHWEEAVELN
jgi:ATP-binding cassette subfamily F protein 3